MKKFKAKKIRKRKNKLKVIVFTFFFFFSYIYAIKYLTNNKLKENILDKSINYINYDLIREVSKKIDESIIKPVNLLNTNVKVIKAETKKTPLVNKDEQVVNEQETIKQTKEYNPLIYIYNTHQSEVYRDYGVYEAALYLSQNLSNKGFDTYFEEQSITTFLQENNLKYYKSYTVSRKYLNEAKTKYQSLNYFFDIHRDALSKEKSTITKDNISYAKIMFVVGGENNSYETNLNNAKKLNDMVENKLPGISRGVIKKEGAGVNGVYNQDFSTNTFLIEIGGNNNTKEEVVRTIDILSDCIREYIKGDL